MSLARPASQPIWKRSHYLERMTLRQLTLAFFQHPAVWCYLLLGVLSTIAAARLPASPIGILAAVAAAGLIYPLVWYALHRWVLHSRWMFKSPLTAGVWKRIHYDHHIDPNHLEVLLGALYTTLPTIALATAPMGWIIAGVPGAAAAFAAGLFITCGYEYVHCIEHLPYKPRSRALAYMKARHLEHHFHDESGNYGITNFAWDRLFGTLYVRSERPGKSPTVFNLGYTRDLARDYPWVAQRSGGDAPDRPVRKR
ncbi:sterol desaturase family protein [Sphingomonas sp. dw_22]|uniref:sterol desaturase family protein n=1 Tax=Sphingomonas sp. dw_22 TaxID=2721175 RepID=UPI001BD48614|nr:sterol desaturase family protein [Sphingomonas sp. dw_22]